MLAEAAADGSKGANTKFATGDDSHQTLRARVAAKQSLDESEGHQTPYLKSPQTVDFLSRSVKEGKTQWLPAVQL